MKAFTFAILYTFALSSYMSTLSFLAPSEPSAPVEHKRPAAFDGVLLLDRVA